MFPFILLKDEVFWCISRMRYTEFGSTELNSTFDSTEEIKEFGCTLIDISTDEKFDVLGTFLDI